MFMEKNYSFEDEMDKYFKSINQRYENIKELMALIENDYDDDEDSTLENGDYDEDLGGYYYDIRIKHTSPEVVKQLFGNDCKTDTIELYLRDKLGDLREDDRQVVIYGVNDRGLQLGTDDTCRTGVGFRNYFVPWSNVIFVGQTVLPG